jgi:TRAP-type C4-dicarboxylate transport system permease small subunit
VTGSGEADRPSAARAQRAALPVLWQQVDHVLVSLVQGALFLIGTLFVLMITLEVVSRYLFDFSIGMVNAGARLLLIWFFLLGAGPALREHAHVGFELLLGRLGPRARLAVLLLGHLLVLAFFAELLWSGLHLLGPGLSQGWAGSEIKLVWVALALPLGALLLIYHLLVLTYVALRAETEPKGAGPC